MANNPLTHFKTFPEFSTLTLADREIYEEFIADFPPYADIAFHNLMTWWSGLGNCKVSMLNGNLVVAYWMPGDEQRSGLGIIGTRKIDESICTLFDYLKLKNEPARLVHIPEFVLSRIRYPELFQCSEERSDDECILSTREFIELEKIDGFKRSRIHRLLASLDEEDVSLVTLDLSQESNKKLLIGLCSEWKGRGPINILPKRTEEAFRELVEYANELDITNLCLFIRGVPHAFIMIAPTAKSELVLVSHGKFSFETPGLYEYSLYRFAKWLHDHGVKKVNIDIDLGDPKYRMAQLALKPTDFFRKYVITPAVSEPKD